MLLLVEKSTKGGIYHSIFDMQKLKMNLWEIMKKLKNHHISDIVGHLYS